MKELMEEIRRSGRLIAEGITLIRKHIYLRWLDWHLDRYIASCRKNQRLFYRIDRMIHRYNKIFNEDLCPGFGKEQGVEECRR